LEFAIPVASSAFHCIPVLSTNRIAFMITRSGTRRRQQPNGCTDGGGINGAIHTHNQSGIRHPSSSLTSPVERPIDDPFGRISSHTEEFATLHITPPVEIGP
jgi:hypothetical protein